MTKDISKYNKEEVNNVYAYNIKDEIIDISEAISGRKGYYCLGCKREMQAVKAHIVGRMSFFRHDAQAVKGQPKCTYSDETYRHKIAKEILFRLKKIKVPAVYKYPPVGYDGKANLLSEARLIEAYSVGIERSFFEDENGQIHCQKGALSVNEKHLLIKPDVTFFDVDEKPILFIEIVVTHKITDDKRIKLKRLGIDTVQIRIPKDSPQEIEKSFFSSQYIKWIYNDEEQRTEYIPIPEGSSEGILPIDEEQRKLFAETSKCRAAQLRNLIRTIERCLESKQYGDVEGELESELSRVERNTKKVREQWAELQGEIQLGIFEQYGSRRTKLGREQGEFSIEEREFQRHYKDLEQRYTTKKGILGIEIRGEIQNIGGNEQPIETRRRNLEREATGVDGDVRNGRRRIEQIKRDRDELESRLRYDIESSEKYEAREIERIQSLFDELPNKFEQRENGVRAEFKYFEETERREIEGVEKFENEFDSNVEQGRRELEGKFKAIRDGIVASIKTRDVGGNTEFTGKLKELIKNGAILYDLEEAQINFKRYLRAWKCFKEGTYQDWF